MNRQEYDSGLFEKPAGKGVQSSYLTCPIIHAGSPIWMLVQGVQLGNPQYGEVLVWDMSKFKRWRGPEQTMDLRKVLYMEGELKEDEYYKLLEYDKPAKFQSFRGKGRLTDLIDKVDRAHKENTGLQAVKESYNKVLRQFISARVATIRLTDYDRLKPTTMWVTVIAEDGRITPKSMAMTAKSPFVSRREEEDTKDDNLIEKDLETEVKNDRVC